MTSPDQGRTLTPPFPLDVAGSAGPMMVSDAGPTGLVAVAWITESSAAVRVATSSDFGETWQPVSLIGTGVLVPGGIGVPTPRLLLAAVSDRAVVVAWSNPASELVARRSLDAGRTWTPVTRLDHGPGAALAGRLATSFDGTFVMAYEAVGGAGSPAQVRVNVSRDEGATWLPDDSLVGLLLVARSSDDYAELALARNGATHVVFHHDENDLELAYSWDHGLPGTWDAATRRLSLAGELQHAARVALTGIDVVNVVHDDYRENQSGCRSTCESIYLDRSCDHGQAWLADEVRLDRDERTDGTHSEDPQIAVSGRGRIHVTWMDGDVPPDGAINVRYVGLDDPGVPRPVVTVTDRRTDPCDAPSYRAEVDPGSLGSCATPAYQWHQDGVAVPGATATAFDVPSTLPPGSHSVQLEVACAGAGCNGASRELILLFPEPGPSPAILQEESQGRCGTTHWVLRADPASLGGCASPEYQWSLDGSPVPGATGSSYDVPDSPPGPRSVHYVVTCAGSSPCRDTSPTVVVDVGAPVSRVVETSLAGILRVAKDPAGLVLRWNDPSGDPTGYNVTSGTLASPWRLRTYDHSGLACQVPRGGATTSRVVAMPAVDTYVLVAPADCAGEGNVGTDSFGVTQPLVGSGAPCGPMP